MELYVVRHGVAEHRDATKWPDDRGRPLTAEGQERLRREAKGLSTVVDSPGRMFSSPLTRAWQTAQILHEEAGWPKPEEMEELEPDLSPEAINSVIESLNVERLALVGHEPNLSELVSLLLTGNANDASIVLKKAGVIAADSRGMPRAGRWSLLWSVPPRFLRSL